MVERFQRKKKRGLSKKRGLQVSSSVKIPKRKKKSAPQKQRSKGNIGQNSGKKKEKRGSSITNISPRSSPGRAIYGSKKSYKHLRGKS